MKNPVVLTVDTANASISSAAILYPQKMQLSLRVNGQSTCSMTLAPECADVEIGSIIQVWAPNGETCIMYVKTRNRDYATKMQTLTLEHVFGLLKDMIAFGEITPPIMSGHDGDTTVSVKKAVRYLLTLQTAEYFKMRNSGDCDFTDEAGWKFTNSDILSALNSIADSIEDCQWQFDFSVFPWRLQLVEIPGENEVDMEMRLARNISGIKVNVDRSQMYTRAYPTGKNDLHIDSVNNDVSYVDNTTAAAQYGIICKVITDSTIDNAALLKKWAQKQVKRNGTPRITVTADGYELSQLTGESLDHFRTGLRCRLTVPELMDDPVVERMTQLNWGDCIAAPDRVTCTLANDLKTMTGILYEQVTQSRGAGSKKANTEHDNELGKHKQSIVSIEAVAIQGVRVTGPVNNVYTLQYQRYNSTSWIDADPGTFSRAISSWTLGWVDGKFTATANPQNQSCWTEIVQGTATYDSTTNKYTVQIDAFDSDNPSYQYDTGRDILITATEASDKVIIEPPVWSNVEDQIYQTVTITTGYQSTQATADHTRYVNMYMDEGSWNNGSRTVRLRSTSAAGATSGGSVRAKLQINTDVGAWTHGALSGDTMARDDINLSMAASVVVNDKTISNTFTDVGPIKLVKNGTQYAYLKYGTTTIANLKLLDS